MAEVAVGNIAFIDGQNLHYSLKDWRIDYREFRTHLREKYSIADAYYHFGFEDEKYNAIYENLRKAGFIVVFQTALADIPDNFTPKKGNVDSDLILSVMIQLLDAPESFDRIVLVSGDGDFFRMVKYLIGKGRFLKILFPNRRVASSLYKKLGTEYYDNLENNPTRQRIQYRKKKKK